MRTFVRIAVAVAIILLILSSCGPHHGSSCPLTNRAVDSQSTQEQRQTCEVRK